MGFSLSMSLPAILGIVGIIALIMKHPLFAVACFVALLYIIFPAQFIIVIKQILHTVMLSIGYCFNYLSSIK